MLKRTVMLSCLLLVAAVVYAGVQTKQPGESKANTAPRADFPFVIKFEQGAMQFNAGDQITINEVRGTSADMQSGICRITGTYTLASQDTATLAASVTANNSADGIGPWNSAQTTTVTKGHGTFTLMLPISVHGCPHVSFYDKSSSFGGIYIGTGDSVLKKWWN